MIPMPQWRYYGGLYLGVQLSLASSATDDASAPCHGAPSETLWIGPTHPPWDAWFAAHGPAGRDRRLAQLNDSLTILMAAEDRQGVALTLWSLVARDIKARRLVRP